MRLAAAAVLLALALATPAASTPPRHESSDTFTIPKQEATPGESAPVFLAEPKMHVWIEVGGTGSDAAWDRDFSRCSERFATFAPGKPFARVEAEGHQLLISTCLRASGWVIEPDYEFHAPLWQPGGSVVM